MVQPIGQDGSIDQNAKRTIRNIEVKKASPKTYIEAPLNNTEVNAMYNTLFWADFNKSMKALEEWNIESSKEKSQIKYVDFTEMTRDLAESNRKLSDALSGMIEALDMENQGMATMDNIG